jgi:hypothetical protein
MTVSIIRRAVEKGNHSYADRQCIQLAQSALLPRWKVGALPVVGIFQGGVLIHMGLQTDFMSRPKINF